MAPRTEPPGLAAAALFGLANLNVRSFKAGPALLVTAIAVLILGPYSYLAGAIVLDFGGKQTSTTASGFIDGVG